MSHALKCWKCGASLAELSLPLRRTDECRACRAELHVCLMCEFYDTTVAKTAGDHRGGSQGQAAREFLRLFPAE